MRKYTITEVGHMEGHEFEYFCAALLKENGYESAEVTPGSGDQGIDVIAQKDGVRYGIQCKCYTSDIGNKAVQEAYSGKEFYNCHIGAVLTNRSFTASATELAKKNRILLWNRGKLIELMKSANVLLANAEKEDYERKRRQERENSVEEILQKREEEKARAALMKKQHEELVRREAEEQAKKQRELADRISLRKEATKCN